ncbi:MAG: hypothetical protein HYR63_07005 [Proteobacteria bacterium]|nr:hypothetical protein [Pseudomonadota bacterium]MBI3498737.1 hypothetical protein [Pseudomonadota bacterium]
MPSPAASHSKDAAEKLRRAFHALWRLGSSALVGWTVAGNSLEILTSPKVRLFSMKSAPRRVFFGTRRMGPNTFAEVARSLEAQPVELRLDHRIGDGPDELPLDAIEQLFEAFAVTRTEHHAVFLIGIAGFSNSPPEQQAVQLSTLGFALNLAAEMARKQGVRLVMHRSTTGDGFYVWNTVKGMEADENLFIGLILFLVFHASLRRSTTAPEAVPPVRIAASVGSHYTYRQPSPDGMGGAEFIVGDVTISLARLVGAARPNQILIGDFFRVDDKTEEVLGLEDFLERVFERTAFLSTITMPGGSIEKVAAYLTGPRRPDGTHRIQRLKVVDKHGYEHQCCNLKINVYPANGETYFCGLQHEDLVKTAKPKTA